MQAEGWTWRRFDSKKPALPYDVKGPKVWLCSGWSERSVHTEYFRCLLTLPELSAQFPGIVSVPHGRTKDTYVKMLSGKAAPELLALGDVGDVEPEAFS